MKEEQVMIYEYCTDCGTTNERLGILSTPGFCNHCHSSILKFRTSEERDDSITDNKKFL